MKNAEVNDALESLWVLVQETSPIVVGSQALHAKFPDVADTLRFSREVDVILPNKARLGNWLVDVVGDGTPFEAERGYYIDHVLPREDLPILASGWKGRCSTRPVMHGGKVTAEALFLSPEDLAVSKLGAQRAKDIEFVAGLFERGLVQIEAVRELALRVNPSLQARVFSSLARVEEKMAGQVDVGQPAVPEKPDRPVG